MLNKLRNKISHAIVGLRYTLRSQSSFRIQLFLIAIILLLNLIEFNLFNLIISLIFITIILSLELINTAIEKVCDFIQPAQDPRIKIIKDISAGAVFLSCISFSIWGIILLVSKMI
jgi:diacylglycerol kinase